MTVETRYFRSDQDTVNGLTAYKLGTSQAGIGLIFTRTVNVLVSSGNMAIDVVKRSSDGTETVIASKAAQITTIAYDNVVTKSATVDIPETALSPTDAIVVRVYWMTAADVSWILCATFITQPLGASKLNAATWTCYYTESLLQDTAAGTTTSKFHIDNAYLSRIDNFTWTPSVPPPLISRVSISDFLKGFGEDNVYSGKAYSQYDNVIKAADASRAFEVSLLDAWNNGTSDTTIGFRFGAGAIRFQKKLSPDSGFIINLIKAKWHGPTNTPFNIYSYDPTPKISFTVTGELV